MLRTSIRKHWLGASFIVGLLVMTGVFDAWLYTCGFHGCPTREAITAFHPPEGGRVLDRNGRLIGRLTLVKRVNVSITKVPRHVREAFIATEDRRFY